MTRLLCLLMLGIPACPMLAGLAAGRLRPAQAARTALLAAAAAFALSVALAAALAFHADAAVFMLRLDPLAAVMTLLVSYLGLVVVRYSGPYMAGDARRPRFFAWLNLSLASVLTLVLAANLALILAAWIATSLCLHRLLLHYPERPGAVFAARKKFVVSRLGDACLLAALIVLERHYGTADLAALFAAAGRGDTGPLPFAGLLIVACAALKSAQFPFHSWLPDTMETPTPVSAFMHAGIINAGGFLVIRLSPLLVHAPGALGLIALTGAATAGFGAVAMLATPTVKRALAFSTIAQMGFMLLQCGLGAFSAAVLHIVAHSLYKAHAFLHSGSTVGAVPRAAVALRTQAIAAGVFAGAILAAAGFAVLHAPSPETGSPRFIFALVLALALAYGLSRAWSAGVGRSRGLGALAVACGVVAASVVLQLGAQALFRDLPSFRAGAVPCTAAGLLFVLLFLFQCVLWRAGRHRWGRQLYVHAMNGFYVGTLANRLLARLWPSQKTLSP